MLSAMNLIAQVPDAKRLAIFQYRTDEYARSSLIFRPNVGRYHASGAKAVWSLAQTGVLLKRLELAQ
jgi:hypothetical protein